MFSKLVIIILIIVLYIGCGKTPSKKNFDLNVAQKIDIFYNEQQESLEKSNRALLKILLKVINNAFKEFNEQIEGYDSEVTTNYGPTRESLQKTWDTYIGKPKNELIKQLNVQLIQEIDKAFEKDSFMIYNNYLVYAEDMNIHIKRENRIPTFIKYNFKEDTHTHKVSISEKDSYNSIVSYVEWTPFLGDALSVADIAGLDIKNHDKKKKAEQYMNIIKENFILNVSYFIYENYKKQKNESILHFLRSISQDSHK